jgi:4-hydroxybenzoate polyprenyltransferase
MLGLLVYVGKFMGYGRYYFSGLAAACLLALWQFATIKKRLKEDCFKAFLRNNWIGLVILLGLIAEYYFRK